MIAKEYWKVWKFSTTGIVVLALLALSGLFLVENLKLRKEQPYYRKKLAAAKLAYRAFESLKPELLRIRKYESKELDPAGSGLIGEFLTPVTSNSGSLSAKQTSINPNFAAIFISYFEKVELKEGDTIAVAISGSFPAANICLFSAIETMKLKPIIISSSSASQYGANLPNMLWLDMESFLIEKGVFKSKTRYASLGGIQDLAVGISEEGKRLLKQGINRNNVSFLEAPVFKDSIQLRMDTYFKEANDKPIKLFVNIGGGTTIFGTSIGKQVFKNGILTEIPEDIDVPDSVIKEFLTREIKVLNIIQIESLARKYGLPISPKSTPKPGEGKIFVQEEFNPMLAGVVIYLIFLGLFGITHRVWGRFQLNHLLPETIRKRV